jgi:hypothetical protein
LKFLGGREYPREKGGESGNRAEAPLVADNNTLRSGEYRSDVMLGLSWNDRFPHFSPKRALVIQLELKLFINILFKL